MTESGYSRRCLPLTWRIFELLVTYPAANVRIVDAVARHQRSRPHLLVLSMRKLAHGFRCSSRPFKQVIVRVQKHVARNVEVICCVPGHLLTRSDASES